MTNELLIQIFLMKHFKGLFLTPEICFSYTIKEKSLNFQFNPIKYNHNKRYVVIVVVQYLIIA